MARIIKHKVGLLNLALELRVKPRDRHLYETPICDKLKQ